MVSGLAESVSSRSKTRPTEKYDSGYSSPGTPEMTQGATMPKVSRYKIVEPPDTILVEPDMSHYVFESSPSRQDRRPSRTATTYNYPVDGSVRHESARPSAKGSPSGNSSRPLFGEIRYARHISPSDIKYSCVEDRARPPPMPRRQSIY